MMHGQQNIKPLSHLHDVHKENINLVLDNVLSEITTYAVLSYNKAVISVFHYLACAPVCSCASNKTVIELLVCVLRRVLMNVPGYGIVNLKEPTASIYLNSQVDQDPLTKSLAMIARHSCGLMWFRSLFFLW
jgi:hypothetical protein